MTTGADMGTAIESRLDRIETKVDKIVDDMSRIARIEERQAIIEDGLNRISRVLDRHEERITALETHTARNTVLVGAGERIFWLVFSAAVSLAAWALR